MSGVGSSSEVQEDCTICDYEKLMPTEIPNCGHQFCYSCIKGVFLSNSPICLLCRGPIDEAIFTTERDVDVKMKVPGLREPDFSVRRFVNNKGVQLTELKPDVEIIRARMNAEAARMFWVYRGRNNGWWRFESRNEKDIEDSFNRGSTKLQMPIVGRLYIVDFELMKQHPLDNPQYAREVKRVSQTEFDALDVKGVAGAYCHRYD